MDVDKHARSWVLPFPVDQLLLDCRSLAITPAKNTQIGRHKESTFLHGSTLGQRHLTKSPQHNAE